MLFPSSFTITGKEWMWLAVTAVGFGITLRIYSGKTPPKWLGLVLLIVFFLYIFTQ
jgi:predicted cobalt transporter CbtA